jgi:hypothetical protein
VGQNPSARLGQNSIAKPLDAPPPPRKKRTVSEFLIALDAGDISGFFLNDFEEPTRGRLAWRFGLTFEDGSAYSDSHQKIEAEEPIAGSECL